MVTHQPSSLQQSPQRKDFEGGVHLGIGGFNLVSFNLIFTTVATFVAVFLANLQLLIRAQRTLLASMCHAVKKKKFL